MERRPAKIVLKTNRSAGGTYYHAYVDGNSVATIRVREHDCEAYDDDGIEVYQSKVKGFDGFADDTERDIHLRAACTAILEYLEPLYEIQDTDED